LRGPRAAGERRRTEWRVTPGPMGPGRFGLLGASAPGIAAARGTHAHLTRPKRSCVRASWYATRLAKAA